LNNYELTTDEYCFQYIKPVKAFTKTFTWKAFKKFGFVKGQILCEKYNIILTDHMTKKERYNYLFDKAVRIIIKKIRGSGKKEKKDFEKIFFGKTKRKKLKIAREKPYDFDKMNNELLGTKRKIW